MPKLKLLAARAITTAIITNPIAALASQGPGGGPGAASHLTQLAMAILIYGGCAMIVAAGLIGGLRKQPR